MNEILRSYLGQNLLNLIEQNLDEYKLLHLDEKQIYKQIYDLNDIVIMCMYLIALDRNESDLAYKIKKANQMLIRKRKEDFKIAFENKNLDAFFSKKSKIDIVNLAKELNLYVLSDKEYLKLSNEEKKMYKALKKYLNKK